jgi:predicted NUDIX family NTP pyrophosphohydrolase
VSKIRRSAGILLYRHTPALEVLLILPGGPFWRAKDTGAWQIPKGAIEQGEDDLTAALREFHEELGVALTGEPMPLTPIRQAGGKWVAAFAIESDLDPAAITSCTFELEWPPRSGRVQTYPEVDRAAWFTIELGRERILKSQSPLLDELARLIG